MMSIDLRDHALPADQTPIILVDMRLRVPLRTGALLHEYLSGKPVPEEDGPVLQELANDLKRQIAEAIGAHELIAARVGAPEPKAPHRSQRQ